jgi:hypothetical protein
MEDKKLYNKIMLAAFCLIMILLCAGVYSLFHGGSTAPEIEVPRGKVQVLQGLSSFAGLEENGIWNF